MKTLKEEVIKMLMDRIGVAEDEEFEACGKNSEYSTYKFHKNELLLKDSEEDWHKTDMWSMFIKYFEECGFKKKPFKPKIGDWYYYVNIFGYLIDEEFNKYNTLDYLNRVMGNCFRTKESAEAHKEEILKILKGEDDE